MTNKEATIQGLQILGNIYDWLEERNFNSWEANMAPMEVRGKRLWEEIQKNPQMTEKEFLKLVEKLKKEK